MNLAKTERIRMSRFTKSEAIAQLWARSDAKQAHGALDRSNGTSQLYPRGADEAFVAAIQRAVAYGEMRAYEAAATDIESGYLGVAK